MFKLKPDKTMEALADQTMEALAVVMNGLVVDGDKIIPRNQQTPAATNNTELKRMPPLVIKKVCDHLANMHACTVSTDEGIHERGVLGSTVCV